jgi:predicted small integral membrane protein
MKYLLSVLTVIMANPAMAQTWGNVAKKEEETGFSWTAPLWPSFWMAWTPATFALFCGIFGAIAVIGVLEVVKFRDGIERRGILGLTTTLGDRLFISLLGTAYIFLAWLGFVGQPLWWPLGISIAWGIFCFRKV